MSEDNKKENSIEEQIARISGNFESDILRLIKTQSMIKTSGGIIDEEIKYLDSKTQQIQDRLNNLNLKTSELSDFLQVSFQDKDISTTQVGLYLNEFIASVSKEKSEVSSLKQELSDRLNKGSDKLNSLHQFYIAELEAFQQEVDSGLTTIREDIKVKIDEELNPPVEEVPEIKEEPEEQAVETEDPSEQADNTQIENEEEYYQKMFASSNAQNGKQDSDDKFLYIALAFLLLCAVGFLGYYFKYIRPNTTGEMVILEDLYEDENQAGQIINDKDGQGNSNTESLPVGNEPAEPKEYLLNETGTASVTNINNDFNHEVIVKRANVRKGPGRNYGVVSVATFGTMVAMLDENSGIWTKIRMQDGKEGWVAKKLLSK